MKKKWLSFVFCCLSFFSFISSYSNVQKLHQILTEIKAITPVHELVDSLYQDDFSNPELYIQAITNHRKTFITSRRTLSILEAKGPGECQKFIAKQPSNLKDKIQKELALYVSFYQAALRVYKEKNGDKLRNTNS